MWMENVRPVVVVLLGARRLKRIDDDNNDHTYPYDSGGELGKDRVADRVALGTLCFALEHWEFLVP